MRYERPSARAVRFRASFRHRALIAGMLLVACLVSSCSLPQRGPGAHGAGSGGATNIAGPAIASPGAARAPPDAGITFPLHTEGAGIVDARGKPVKLAMVNWYGAESPDFVVGGLAYQPIHTIIREIVSMRFNGVRLPWSNQMWEQNPVVPSELVAANPQFAGERARTIFEQVVRDLASAGLMIVLDDHSSQAEWCCSLTDGNTLWYNSGYPQAAWLSDWASVAVQFADIPQVVGVDLRNEPRGKATWGGSDPSVDWQRAAELGGAAVQRIAPHLLIFVEGIHAGTDLSGVADLPVVLRDPAHVVYEVHDYGAEHKGAAPYNGWLAQIRPDWGYLVGRYPLWIGEFGTCNTSDACVAGNGAAHRGVWFSTIVRYLQYHNLNWSYWSLNGTRSDGLAWQGRAYGAREGFGVLDTRWDGLSRQSLLAVLSVIERPCPSAPLADGTYYILNASSGQVIGIPDARTANGTRLEQEKLSDTSSQRWHVTSLGCGLYSMTSAADRRSIDVSGQSDRAGAVIDEWTYWGGGNQQFVVRREPTGYYTFASINSMEPVGVSRFAIPLKAQLHQGGTGSGRNQQWAFRRA
jgi:endoglucanase